MGKNAVLKLFFCPVAVYVQHRLPVNFCGTEFLRLATLLASRSSRRARSVPMCVLEV